MKVEVAVDVDRVLEVDETVVIVELIVEFE